MDKWVVGRVELRPLPVRFLVALLVPLLAGFLRLGEPMPGFAIPKAVVYLLLYIFAVSKVKLLVTTAIRPL